MTRDIQLIVIGGSAGSLQPVLRILTYLKADFSIPVLLVLHRNNQFDSSLKELLSAKISLTPKEVEEKEKIRSGFVYICPADYHVLIEKDHTLSLDISEKINFSRPSIDVVFESAAAVYANKLVSILLSGANADGTEGLVQVKKHGGIAVVQQPEDAVVSYMPANALRKIQADYILSSNEIAGFLNSFMLK